VTSKSTRKNNRKALEVLGQDPSTEKAMHTLGVDAEEMENIKLNPGFQPHYQQNRFSFVVGVGVVFFIVGVGILFYYLYVSQANFSFNTRDLNTT